MLVLTRQAGDRITLTDAHGQHLATIEVVFARSGRVRLAFTADRAIGIDRHRTTWLNQAAGPSTNGATRAAESTPASPAERSSP